MQPSRPSPEQLLALSTYLRRAFTMGELRKLLISVPEAGHVAEELLIDDHPISTTQADQIVGKLERHGLIDATFFAALARVRPKHRIEVERMAREVGESVDPSPSPSAVPVEHRLNLDPMLSIVAFAKVLLDCGWTTYGLRDLLHVVREQSFSDSQSAVQALTFLIRELTRLNRVVEATDLLSTWLLVNPESAHAAEFRLWRILLLNHLDRHEDAVAELLGHLQSFPETPALLCLRGNLLTKTAADTHHLSDGVKVLQRVVERDDWSEPRLELLECLVRTGDYAQAVALADRYMCQSSANSRARIVLGATRVVGLALQLPAYREGDAFRRDQAMIDAIDVPEAEKEEWRFDYFRECLIAAAGQDGASAFFLALIDWLRTLEDRVLPTTIFRDAT